MHDDGTKYTSALIEPLTRRAMHVTLLVAIAMVVFLAGAGKTALTDKEESRYALVAKNMVDSGDYLRPHTVIDEGNEKPYFDKPPLYFWLTAISFKVFGTDNLTFSARVVPAVGAALALVAVYLVASAMFNHILGLVSTACMLTMAMTIWFGKYVRMDIYLAAFIGFALWAFIKGYQRPEKKRWFILMYLALALGFLTKGPIAIVIPAAVIVIFLLLQRRMGLIWRMRLILGVAILIVLVGPWFVYMMVEYKTYFQEFFIRHNALRFCQSKLFGHDESFVRYPLVILGCLLPWTGGTILACARYAGGAFKRNGNDWQSQFLLIWAGFVLVFFAVSATRRVNYILPALIPLALLTGRYFYDYWESDFRTRRMHKTFLWAYPVAFANCAFVVAVLTAGAIGAIYVKFHVHWTNLPDMFGEGFWGRWGWLICTVYRLAAAAILARAFFIMLRERHLERIAWLTGIVTLLIAIDLSYTELPRIADATSARRLITTAARYRQAMILAGPEERRSIQLYLRDPRTVRQLDHVAEFSIGYSDSPHEMLYMTTDNSAFNQIPLSMQNRMVILHQFQENRVVLIRPLRSQKPPDEGNDRIDAEYPDRPGIRQ